MSDQVWYIFQNDTRMGPFSTDVLLQYNNNKMIAKDALIFKVGWADWRPIAETWKELGFAGAMPEGEKDEKKRRGFAPRITVHGKVIVHNNGKMTIGKGVNISTSGIFLETTDQLFTIGETLKITIRLADLPKSYNCTAQVIRYNSNAKWPVGYGLMFENCSDELKSDIKALVESLGEQSDVGVAN